MIIVFLKFIDKKSFSPMIYFLINIYVRFFMIFGLFEIFKNKIFR